jgi:exosortase K
VKLGPVSKQKVAQAFPPPLADRSSELRRGTPKRLRREGGRPANAALKRCAAVLKPYVALWILTALFIWRLKRYYADARVDDLRWILDPTTRVVTALTGVRFEWDAGQGHVSRESLFVIAKVCAGINFLIAAFGMTAWMLARRAVSAASLAAVLIVSLLTAYFAAVVVNAARISFALWLAAHPGTAWMTAAQAHRMEGIAFYFGGLLFLYVFLTQFERRSIATPLVWYYAITIAIPLANGASDNRAAFIEHASFVLILPLALLAAGAAGRQLLSHRAR